MHTCICALLVVLVAVPSFFVARAVGLILPYGAFCALDEYANRESFMHISEVAPWLDATRPRPWRRWPGQNVKWRWDA